MTHNELADLCESAEAKAIRDKIATALAKDKIAALRTNGGEHGR